MGKIISRTNNHKVMQNKNGTTRTYKKTGDSWKAQGSSTPNNRKKR